MGLYVTRIWKLVSGLISAFVGWKVKQFYRDGRMVPREEGPHWHYAPAVRLLLRDGGGGFWGPGLPPADPPAIPDQKNFPREKNEMYERGRKFDADLRYTNLFLASDRRPPGVGCPALTIWPLCAHCAPTVCLQYGCCAANMHLL